MDRIARVLSEVRLTPSATEKKQQQFAILKNLFSTTLKDLQSDSIAVDAQEKMDQQAKAVQSSVEFGFGQYKYDLRIETFKEIMTILD